MSDCGLIGADRRKYLPNSYNLVQKETKGNPNVSTDSNKTLIYQSIFNLEKSDSSESLGFKSDFHELFSA